MKNEILVLHDQHMHSSFSRDSNEDLKSYFIKANELKINYVITCEHYDFCTAFDHTTWDVDYDMLIEKQKELKKEFPNITPLLGLELGYRKDYFKEMEEISTKYPFDLIQLSIHDNGKHDYYFKDAFDKGIEYTMNEYFDLMLEGCKAFKNYDVLSHIDFGFKTAVMIDSTQKINKYEKKIKEIMKLIIADNKAFEVNSKVLEVINSIYSKEDSNYKYDDHLRYLLGLYKECGGKKITLSSDAHVKEKYRLDFDKHLKTIKEMGFTEVLYFIKREEHKFYL